MDYKKFILNILLSKYENSKHYMEKAAINRRILLRFNKSEFPQYDIEKWDVKETINSAVKELKSQDIINYSWKKYEKGNIIESVWLIIENLQNAYILAGRVSKADEVLKTIEKLKNFSDTIKLNWIKEFISISIQAIEEKRKFTNYIPQDEESQNLILKALFGIDNKGEEETLERVFSIRYLGGSKVFEKKVRRRVITIIKDFMLKGEELEDEEILEQVGIIKTSEDLLFRGPLVVKLDNNIIDFGDFIYGASMNTQTIRNFLIKELDVKRVITIENKANYLEYIDKNKDNNMLIIYLAGFYSPVKSLFLQRVYDFLRLSGQKVEFYHWGDIDLGGFKIFTQLKNRIKDLKPLKMDVETLAGNIDYCDRIDDKYARELKKLLLDERYKAFYNVIEYMLEKKVRLEQEALL